MEFKFNLCQAVVIKQYGIEGTVQDFWVSSRNPNIQYNIEYVEHGVIHKIWLNEVELDYITRLEGIKEPV
jgi:hypothetical protein